MARTTGRYESTAVGGEAVAAFVPHPLPPCDPPIQIKGAIAERLAAAERALGLLELAADMVPSVDWFLYAFVRKEAVVSSQIEGTQATLVDLLAFEAEESETPGDDVEEICNYVRALDHARQRLADESGLPLSMRLINEAHGVLLQGARGATRSPGEVRRSQNWIGGTRPGNAVYVPPPPHLVPELLGALERYIHQAGELPPLVRAGLVHAQFESIHPYLDGNGRVGRLLVSLLLEHWKLLSRPVLYLSLFFKRHRSEYYRRLDAVRTDGAWEAWLDYFLEGVEVIGGEAVASARALFGQIAEDRARVLSQGTTSVAALRLFEGLPRHPILTVASVVRLLETTKPTAGRAIDTLVESGVLVETTGRTRNRSFAYQAYLDLLRVGTELETVPGRGAV